MDMKQLAPIVTILVSLIGGVYFLYKEYRKRQLKNRKNLSGEWTNEGDVTRSHLETHYMDVSLSIDTEDGEITGLVASRNLQTGASYNYISANGHFKYKSGIVTLRMSNRGLTVIGKVKISGTKKQLMWKMIGEENDLIPAKTLLHRNPIKDTRAG